MAISCERCKKEIFKGEKCTFCNRLICDSCTKSAQRIHKTVRMVICNDCWTNTQKRNLFKNKITERSELPQ